MLQLSLECYSKVIQSSKLQLSLECHSKVIQSSKLIPSLLNPRVRYKLAATITINKQEGVVLPIVNDKNTILKNSGLLNLWFLSTLRSVTLYRGYLMKIFSFSGSKNSNIAWEKQLTIIVKASQKSGKLWLVLYSLLNNVRMLLETLASFVMLSF